jgi:hypothetical protein
LKKRLNKRVHMNDHLYKLIPEITNHKTLKIFREI